MIRGLETSVLTSHTHFWGGGKRLEIESNTDDQWLNQSRPCNDTSINPPKDRFWELPGWCEHGGAGRVEHKDSMEAHARSPLPALGVSASCSSCCCSVATWCLTLCDPMNHSTPGLPVHHRLLGFAQTHVHWVSDAIQPSHPLWSPSPPAPNPSQHQGLFQWASSSHQVFKVLELRPQHQSF